MLPSVLTAAPPPRLDVTPLNWPTLTASVFSVPAAMFVTVRNKLALPTATELLRVAVE